MGSADTACGTGGLWCNTCAGGQVCTEAKCVFPPPPQPVDAGMPLVVPAEAWTWAPFPDSQCGNASATGLGVNRTTRSKDVLLYLQGGGACWNALTCSFAASNLNGYGAASFAREQQLGAEPFQRVPQNPFKDMSYVFVPYCTGDVHGGDSVQNYPGAGAQISPRTVFHKGAKNLEAFLVRLKDTFPDATRVFISGSSAGAFGAQLNFERVARTWPTAQVHVLADSGQMVTPAGTILADQLAAWNAAVPANYTDCATQFENFPKYLHGKYPRSRFGLFAFTQDSTLRQFAGLDGATYEQKTLALAASAYDSTSNAKYFIVAGNQHTMFGQFFTQQGPGGVALVDWTTRFVNADAAWANVKP